MLNLIFKFKLYLYILCKYLFCLLYLANGQSHIDFSKSDNSSNSTANYIKLNYSYLIANHELSPKASNTSNSTNSLAYDEKKEEKLGIFFGHRNTSKIKIDDIDYATSLKLLENRSALVELRKNESKEAFVNDGEENEQNKTAAFNLNESISDLNSTLITRVESLITKNEDNAKIRLSEAFNESTKEHSQYMPLNTSLASIVNTNHYHSASIFLNQTYVYNLNSNSKYSLNSSSESTSSSSSSSLLSPLQPLSTFKFKLNESYFSTISNAKLDSLDESSNFSLIKKLATNSSNDSANSTKISSRSFHLIKQQLFRSTVPIGQNTSRVNNTPYNNEESYNLVKNINTTIRITNTDKVYPNSTESSSSNSSELIFSNKSLAANNLLTPISIQIQTSNNFLPVETDFKHNDSIGIQLLNSTQDSLLLLEKANDKLLKNQVWNDTSTRSINDYFMGLSSFYKLNDSLVQNLLRNLIKNRKELKQPIVNLKEKTNYLSLSEQISTQSSTQNTKESINRMANITSELVINSTLLTTLSAITSNDYKNQNQNQNRILPLDSTISPSKYSTSIMTTTITNINDQKRILFVDNYTLDNMTEIDPLIPLLSLGKLHNKSLQSSFFVDIYFLNRLLINF
jgi:hypothetical protein